MEVAIKAKKPGKEAGLTEVCAEITPAGSKVGISVVIELCQHVLDGKGMLDERIQVCWYQFSREREMLEFAILTEK